MNDAFNKNNNKNLLNTTPVITDIQPLTNKALSIITSLNGNRGNCRTCQPRRDG